MECECPRPPRRSNGVAVRCRIAALGGMLALQVVIPAPAAEKPDGTPVAPPDVLWDLESSEIPMTLRSGSIERMNGAVVLRGGASFAVPAGAFPDHRNFTVQVTASLDELVEHAVFTAMVKQSEGDDGFAFSLFHRDAPANARRTNAVVNRILMVAPPVNGSRGPQLHTPATFTLAVREGLATFYVDDAPYKTCFMEMIPNDEPMWIGRNADAKSTAMPATIHAVKVFGPSFRYTSRKERPAAFPRGVVAGRGWAVDTPKVEHADWPKVLIYGDSISNGYAGPFIPKMLERQAYVFHCVHFVGGEVPEQPLTEMANRYPFDVVVFNNGLHSLHWAPDAVPDAVVRERMRKLARCFTTGAPQAKPFYLTTTPHTAARPAPDRPVEELGGKNDVVVRLNRLSMQVMEEEGIEVIDVYPLLASRLDLASGDGYHWQGPAYTIIADAIVARIAGVLGAPARSAKSSAHRP